MQKVLPKIIATLLGIVLLFGAANTVSASAVDVTDDLVLKGLTCNPLTNWTGCFPTAIFYLFYIPTTWVLIIVGYMFDTAIALSINTAFVNQDFVSQIWTVVRDFSNMLFIFILLYTGIQAIFGVNWRGTVLKVVMLALLINFSLFFTKVVIDAGNILAVGIYETMGAVKTSATGAVLDSGKGIQERNISEALIANFQPQKFLAKAGEVSGTDATVVFIVAIIVSGFAAFIMFKVALLFVGRLLAFWFVMIASPFAFISMALPKGNMFNSWLDILIKQAFVAPLFLFLLYALMRIVSSGNGLLSNFAGSSVGAAKFLFDTLLGPILVAIVVIMALKEILKIAESMSGGFGKVGSEIISGAMGAAGIAAGGTALLGRKVVGGYAAKKLASGTLEEGSRAEAAAKWATRSSFDLRDGSMKIPTSMKDLDKYIGKGAGKGGFEKLTIDSNKKQLESDIAAAKAAELNVFRQAQIRIEGAEAQKSYEAAQKADDGSTEKKAVVTAQTKVVEITKEAKTATEKKAAAEVAHTAMRNSGKFEKAIKDDYDRARAEEEEALKKLTKAEGELAEAAKAHESSATAKALKEAAGKVFNAKDKIKEDNKARQLAFADSLDSKRYASAEKIREAYKEKKPKDVLIEALENMQKEAKEREEKEKEGKEEKPKEGGEKKPDEAKPDH